MAPRHTRGGARDIGQDAVERHTVPPVGEPRAIRAGEVGAQRQPAQIALEAREARCIDVKSRQLDAGGLQDVCTFATGRGAGIEHAQALGQVQAAGGALSAGVLDGERALLESRKTLHGKRAIQEQCVLTDLAGRNPVGGESGSIVGNSLLAPVYAEAHRRMIVAGAEDRFPVYGLRSM